MCLARGVVGGEWMRELGLGFTNRVGTGGVLDGCMCCGGVGGEWVGGLDQCLVLCLCGISQIQTCLCEVVGPGFVSTSPALMRISASHPAAQTCRKNGKSGPHCWGGWF